MSRTKVPNMARRRRERELASHHRGSGRASDFLPVLADAEFSLNTARRCSLYPPSAGPPPDLGARPMRPRVGRPAARRPGLGLSRARLRREHGWPEQCARPHYGRHTDAGLQHRRRRCEESTPRHWSSPTLAALPRRLAGIAARRLCLGPVRRAGPDCSPPAARRSPCRAEAARWAVFDSALVASRPRRWGRDGGPPPALLVERARGGAVAHGAGA